MEKCLHHVSQEIIPKVRFKTSAYDRRQFEAPVMVTNTPVVSLDDFCVLDVRFAFAHRHTTGFLAVFTNFCRGGPVMPEGLCAEGHLDYILYRTLVE
jgi:hypothetical protein